MNPAVAIIGVAIFAYGACYLISKLYHLFKE